MTQNYTRVQTSARKPSRPPSLNNISRYPPGGEGGGEGVGGIFQLCWDTYVYIYREVSCNSAKFCGVSFIFYERLRKFSQKTFEVHFELKFVLLVIKG
jgi:hypothetical protein